MLNQKYLCGALAALSGAPVLFAQTKPTLWVQTNDTISTNATSNCDVIKMITATTHRGIVRTGSEDARYQSAFDDGVAAADDACDEILGRTNPSERVAIHFYAFGAGSRYGDPYDDNANYWDQAPTLGFHVDDRLTPTCSSGPHFQMTPWLDHSKAEASAWMKGFCQQYRARQIASPTIPNPEHFSFDNEAGVGVGNLNSGEMTTWATYIDCLMSDDRSGANSAVANKWRYLPGNLGERRTLAQSYKDARVRYDGQSSDTVLPLSSGNPNPSAITSASPLVQQLFASWVNGLFGSLQSEVLDAAVRPVANAYFPGCTFGNFGYATADGGVEAQLLPYIENSAFDERQFCNTGSTLYGTSGRRLMYDTVSGWGNVRFNNAASADSPVFYGLGPCSGFVRTNESILDQYFVFMRAQLDAINFSWDRTRRHHIIPWIYGKPNMQADISTTWSLTNVIDDNWYRDVYAVGRAKGVKDYLYFQPDDAISSGDKSAIDTVMGDVWKTSASCVVASLGSITSSGSASQAVAESDAVTLDMSSVLFQGIHVANCVVQFKVKSGFNPAKLKIVVEAHATYSDNSTPAAVDEIVFAARPFRTTDSTYFAHYAAGIAASTTNPTVGSVVATPAAHFIVAANSGGACSANGEQEIWIWLGAQNQGGYPAKAFNMHVDNVQVYGYD